MKGLTEGRIVHYVLTVANAKAINRRRVPGAGHGEGWPQGAQAHYGNPVQEGDHLPMMIVKVWTPEGTINGKVFLDGNDSYWATSVTYDPTAAGCWHWIEPA